MKRIRRAMEWLLERFLGIAWIAAGIFAARYAILQLIRGGCYTRGDMLDVLACLVFAPLLLLAGIGVLVLWIRGELDE